MQPNQEDNDNHAAWVENAGFIYDRLLIQKLKWPSLTFQWLPYRQQNSTQTNYRCLYATHSSGGAAAEHLIVAEVSFPHLRDLQDEPTQMAASKIRTIYRHTHESEINRARCCPTEPELIAARCDNGPVSLFKMGSEYPAHLLEGNLNGGFALDWSEHGLVSGDFDGKAYFWSNPDNLSNVLEYGSSIEDVKWAEPNQLAIVGDNGYLSFWDLRSNSIVQHTQAVTGEKKELYSAAVNPVQRQLVLTGGEDENVRIWDRRNLSAGLHKFEGHEGSVMSVEWSKVNGSVFASGGADKKVKIWDLMRVGFQIPKDLGGTDELLLTHEGHKGGVNDLGWNPYEMLLGSCEEQANTLQFYQMTNNIHELQYAEDIEYLREQCFA